MNFNIFVCCFFVLVIIVGGKTYTKIAKPLNTKHGSNTNSKHVP